MEKQRNSASSTKNAQQSPREKTKAEDQRKGPVVPHEENEEDDESLDRTIEDSFPASDPPSSIPDPDEDAA